MKIIMLCFGGWSSSLLARRLEKGLESLGEPSSVVTMGLEKGLRELENYDLVLVAPQMRHMTAKVKEISQAKGVPVVEVAMGEYAMENPQTLIHRRL